MSDAAPGPQKLSVKPKTLMMIVGGGLLAGAFIVLGWIMPAEFNADPLGIGRLTGVSKLWAPDEVEFNAAGGSAPLAREYPTAFRTDVIEIPLTGFLGGAENSELEYKVAMKTNATLVYDWEVVGASRPDDFHFDFHGHTVSDQGQAMTVATYRQAYGLSGHGALTAPFDGIQGWQFSNSSDEPIVVRVKLAGFYELVPGGAEGNLACIAANVPAAQARPASCPKL
jgi:hypothetical protein